MRVPDDGPQPTRPSRLVPGAPSLLGLYVRAALSGVRRHGGTTVSGVILRRVGVRVDPDRLAVYRLVCGFADSGALPATYPHILAFPLHLMLMTDPEFPFAAMGAVHIANTIEQVRPIGVAETLDLTVRAERMTAHPRGRVVTLASQLRSDGEAVWREETVLLSRGEADGDLPATPEQNVPDHAPAGQQTWRLKGTLGRRYAGVSGDVNPIHLSMASAKAFGFRRQIAHGMWTKARALGELGPRLGPSYRVEVSFKKPLFLPATVGFGAHDPGGTLDFGVTSPASGLAHLVGRVTASG